VVARTDVTDNELGKFSEEDSVFMWIFIELPSSKVFEEEFDRL
jgi:hypothetical protein